MITGIPMRLKIRFIKQLLRLAVCLSLATFSLVGHSYGGPLARMFTQMYPAEVRAIVFVDPMSETLIINDPKRAEHMAQQAAVLQNASRGILAEWAYLQKEADRNYTDLLKVAKPNVPMALIVATIDRPEGWRKTSLDQYGSWLVDRNDSMIVVTPNSSHNVQRDEPALVVSAIRTLLFPNPLVALDAAANRGGADAVMATFREQQALYPKTDITPRALNTIGYHLLQKKRPADAALTSYRKAFAMDPTNNNAKNVIDQLQKK